MQDETLPDKANGSHMEQLKKKVKELRVKRDWAHEIIRRL